MTSIRFTTSALSPSFQNHRPEPCFE